MKGTENMARQLSYYRKGDSALWSTDPHPKVLVCPWKLRLDSNQVLLLLSEDDCSCLPPSGPLLGPAITLCCAWKLMIRRTYRIAKSLLGKSPPT